MLSRTRGNLSEIVSRPGQIQPKTKVTISAKTTARIVDLPFEEGAVVKKGDLSCSSIRRTSSRQLRAAQAQHSASSRDRGAQAHA